DQAVRLPAREVVRPGELERGLDRLRTAGHRVDRGTVDRQVPGDLPRICLERLGREGAAVGVGQATGLGRHRGRDLGTAVAHVDDDGPAGRVEVLVALRVADGRPERLDGDGRLRGARTTEDATGVHGRIVADARSS